MVKLLHWCPDLRLDTSPGPCPHTLTIPNLPSYRYGDLGSLIGDSQYEDVTSAVHQGG